jgi:hypothetical protein
VTKDGEEKNELEEVENTEEKGKIEREESKEKSYQACNRLES